MKSYFFLIVVLIFSVSINLYPQFSGGEGRAANPYLITSHADLEALADSVNNGDWWSQAKFFRLENDITDSVRTIIGLTAPSPNGRKHFQGDFDGNGKKITLAISGENAGQYVGMFSAIDAFGVYDLTVDGYVRGNSYTGGLCGVAGAKITNCANYCNITSGGVAGGICGYASVAELTNCTNYGTIQAATNYTGGVCGSADRGSRILNSTNYGTVVGMFCVGGLCGNAVQTTLYKCKNYGNVTSTVEYAGGIAGAVVLPDTTRKVSDCRNYGTITAGHAAGGIAGCIAIQTGQFVPSDFFALSLCANAGTITATTAAGGITGHSHEKTNISQCLNIGTVWAEEYVGGITSGYDNIGAEQCGDIRDCQNAGLVSGHSYVGGIAGRANGYMAFMVNTGVVIGSTNVAAIVGEMYFGLTDANWEHDKQMSIYSNAWNRPASGWYAGRLTERFTGREMGGFLSSGYWTCDYSAEPILYPILKHFLEDSIGIVARAPVYLDTADGKDYDTQRKVRTNFKVNLENNVKWDRINGNVDIVNDDGILINDGEDTLVCSLGNIKKLVPINVIMPPVGDINFTIWATDHKLVDPSRKNYRIPIYIKADADTPREIMIERLIVEIDKNIFYAKRSDNGTLANKTLNENIVEITIENIKIPTLNANKEIVLFNLTGDMLLGTEDSSGININKPVKFAGSLNTSPEQINGSITLDICHEGNDRFVTNAGKSPSIVIKNNPAREFLEVECNIAENENYSLKVVDMTGRATKVKEFVTSEKESQFHFALPTTSLSPGNYLLILTYKGYKYSAPFIVEK